ncbi:LysR family transcriptional regulator [Sulfitobacter sp.]|uniref:LysR family transcriptional regulator n=1 Tax=Sulfitobacter sp. TaxID=1903071 RepID=UPI003002D55D
MDKWTEIKTAYQIARLGTVSAAADVLGVHRATVIRHIDTLEAELGARVFLRNRTGYTPTEVGEDLLRVAHATEEQFEQLAGRTRSRSAKITGDLIVTAHERTAPLLLPALQRFQDENKSTVIKFIASAALLKLEYGEAHVAIRSGPKPDQPDNIVQPYHDLKFGLYAHESYVAHNGLPQSRDDYCNHRFVCWEQDKTPFPFTGWLRRNVPQTNKTLISANQGIADQALFAGMGIGFHPEIYARKRADLVEILAPQPDWVVPLWLVTHTDLHRSAKVQAVLKFIKNDRSSR